MTMFLVSVEAGSLTVASDVPDGHVPLPPWRVVTLDELEELRDRYERNPIPTSVTARQIRLWLVQHGISLAAVESAIDAIPDAITRDSVRVEWEYAPYVERSHAMLVPLAQALGLTEAQVDQAFREAAGL